MDDGVGESRPREGAVGVLIVDDEVHALEGLRRGVAWETLGVRRLVTARNIRQAKKLLLAEPIDIVVCDIEMPQGSGLDLVSWMNGNRQGIDAIFLTCHAEFEYARQAVQLGSFDYLLKPVPYAELEKALRKLIDRRARGRKDREYLGLGMRWEREKGRLAESFWTGVLTGRIAEDDRGIASRAAGYGISVDPGTLCVPALLEVPGWRKGYDARDEGSYRYAVRKAAEEFCGAAGPAAPAVYLEEGRLVAVHLLPPGSGAPVAEGTWENFRAYCLEHFGCAVRCLIGPASPLSALAASVDALAAFAAHGPACRDGIVRMDFLERSRSAVRTARRYIEAHLTDEITCGHVAAHVGLNADYLSRVFKKETGQSVNEYLIAAKMAAARDLLSGTAMSVSEIAMSVGYSNFSHFAAVFKIHFGSTPSAFRTAGAGGISGSEKSENG